MSSPTQTLTRAALGGGQAIVSSAGNLGANVGTEP